MNDPLDIAFGPDSNLYIADHTTDQVLKYDGTTGAFLSVLITAGSGGLNTPYSLAFLPPRPPASTELTGMTGTSVSIRWRDMSDDETNFAVYRRSYNSDWTQIAMLPSNTQTFTDTGLIAGIPYAYQVVALNTIGRSVPGELVPAVTPSPLPRAPGELMAWPIGGGQVFLGWNPHEGDVLGYAIWRKGGGSDWTAVSLLMSPIATGYIDTGLKSDTAYVYRIRAIGSNGTSEWSNETAVLTPALPLPAPNSLAATVVSATQVDLTWSLGSTNETGVTVWRKIGAGSYARIAVLPAGTTSYSDTTTLTGTSYSYEVRVNNSYYVSPFSNVVSVTTP
jgi:titin